MLHIPAPPLQVSVLNGLEPSERAATGTDAQKLRVGVLAGEPDLHLISVLGGEGKAPMFWDAATALAEALANRGLKVRLTRNELARAGTNFCSG